VVLIPEKISLQLAEACKRVQLSEKPIIEGCREKISIGIEIDEIRKLREKNK